MTLVFSSALTHQLKSKPSLCYNVSTSISHFMILYIPQIGRLCPNCKLGDYSSIQALISHFNSPSTCWPFDARPQTLPIPSVFNQCGRIPVTGTCYPQSGYVYGVGRNMLDKLEDDQYAYRQKINPYYPFHDEGEWELGKFLVENLTQTQITKFLKLRWVNDEYQSKLYS